MLAESIRRSGQRKPTAANGRFLEVEMHDLETDQSTFMNFGISPLRVLAISEVNLHVHKSDLCLKPNFDFVAQTFQPGCARFWAHITIAS